MLKLYEELKTRRVSNGNILEFAHGHESNASGFWTSQQVLPEQHSGLYEEFTECDFSVWRTIGKFVKIFSDHVIESRL